MVRRRRLQAAVVAVAAPTLSVSLFVATLFVTFPPKLYEVYTVLLLSYAGLQMVLLFSAPISAAMAMLLSRGEAEGGWRLIAVRFVMPVVGLLLWLIAGTSQVIVSGAGA